MMGGYTGVREAYTGAMGGYTGVRRGYIGIRRRYTSVRAGYTGEREDTPSEGRVYHGKDIDTMVSGVLPGGSDERTDGEERRGQGRGRVRRSVGHETRTEPQDQPRRRVVSTQCRHH